MKSLFVVALFVLVSFVAARAPVLNLESKTIIPNQYIIVLHKNSSEDIRDFHVAELQGSFGEGARLLNKFAIGTLIGYSAVLTKDALEAVAQNPNVRYVEADQVVTITEDPEAVQQGATWGINRISQRALPLDTTYNYFSSSGAGVVCYVIDTGIQTTHQEFAGRARFGISFTGETIQDGNGHGTHVAGTIGGTVYGVAKKTTLVGVQVLNAGGSGSWEGVIAGINWVTQQHKAQGNKARSVANMSLGGGVAPTVDEAVEQSIAAGVIHVIAAGNSNANACNYSPARSPNAITVGATTSTDLRATFSNYGTCVDIFAPGNLITAAWIGNTNTATSTISGTSMASPHVAGAAAIYLGHLLHENDQSEVPSPATVNSYLRSFATKDVIVNPGTGSQNLLLYSPFTKTD